MRVTHIRFFLTARVARSTLAGMPHADRSISGSPCGLDVFLGVLSG
jgi:hypothetical protein